MRPTQQDRIQTKNLRKMGGLFISSYLKPKLGLDSEMNPSISSFKVRLAIQKINAGELIAYPTEAVYGMGCDPLNRIAVLNLLELKQRSIEKGLILIASSLAQLRPFLQLNDSIISRIQLTWPEPVT